MRRLLLAGLLAAASLPAACRSQEQAPDIAALIADLTSTDPERSGRANLALVGLGEPAVPALVETLRSQEPRLRATAATTLWGMGPKARAAVPALAAALSDQDHEVRVAAAMALENMDPGDAKEAIPALIRALKDREGRVRQWAAKALGKIGPPAREAIPALNEAARFDPVRPAAEEAIRQIQGP